MEDASRDLTCFDTTYYLTATTILSNGSAGLHAVWRQFVLTTRIIIEIYVQVHIALMFRTWFGVALELERALQTEMEVRQFQTFGWIEILFDLSTNKSVLLICRSFFVQIHWQV